MKISIKNLYFKAILGILAFERTSAQTILVDATLWYAYDQRLFIDYADVCALIEKHMQSKHFGLIEDALKDLSYMLLEKYPQATKIKLKISKPDILPNAIVGVTHTQKCSKN